MEKENREICHICGQLKELTFEHLPPKKANNSNRVRTIVGDELTKHIAGNNMPWVFSGHRYKNMQRGMGTMSICKECNNPDITYLADGLKYDGKCFVELSLYLRSVNSMYPFDYRTKDEIEKDMIKSKAETIQMYSDMLKEKDKYSGDAIELIKKYKQNEITVGEFSTY